jgi:hypothetical protein
MSKVKKLSPTNEHRKRFPFPEIGDSDLSYGGITIPLKGGHSSLFGFFSNSMMMVEDGWISQGSGFTQIIEMQAGAKYKNEPTTREAIAKLNRKFKEFEKVGLKMHIRGDYRRVFQLKLTYKSTGTK